jgi:hypothetical protein
VKPDPSPTEDPCEDRSIEDHPAERAGDKRIGGRLRIYFWRYRQDIWLLVITGLVLWSLVEIQHSRWDAQVDACEETNRRHDNTIASLNAQVKLLKPTLSEEQLKNLERNVKSNVALINALVPKTPDCAALADERVGHPLF